MKNSITTISFLAFGAVMLIVATSVYWATRPTTNIEFELVGKPFFDDFDPSAAKTLEVSALDPETGDLRQFQVENKNGLWVIPTHYDYPAEAAERLANTTSALMGLKRDALQARLESEHGTYGVVDPLGDEVGSPDEAGTRVLVKDADGNVVVDYIIGDPVKSSDTVSFERRTENTQYFYVRVPEEQQTFKVAMDIDLSTQFTDWIEKDFLKLSMEQLSRMVIDNYSIEQKSVRGFTQARLVEGDTFVLERATSSDPWQLDGIDESSESTNTGKIDAIAKVIDEMEIVDVRRKLRLNDGRQILKPDLTLNLDGLGQLRSEVVEQLFATASSDLGKQGFFLNSAEGVPEDERLFAKRGKVQAGTTDGVNYTIYFGDAYAGNRESIDINKQDDGNSTEGTEQTDSSSDSNDKVDTPDRFVMVRVNFDEALLGPPPQKPDAPTEPTKPAEYIASSDYEKQFAAGGDQSSPPPKPPGYEDKLKSFVEYEDALVEFTQKQQQYETDLKAYEEDAKARNETADKGQQKIKELNERFGAWYYVVKAENVETMRLSRDELVTANPSQPQFPGLPELPGIPNIEFPKDETNGSGSGSKPEESDELPDPSKLVPKDDGKKANENGD